LSAAAPAGRWWGVDPGKGAGAAVRIADDGRTALEVVEWRDSTTVSLPILPGDVVALEAPYLGKNPASFRALVEWRERFRLGLPPGVVVAEPLAVQWRAKVLRVARVPRKRAKELAIAAAKANAIGLPAEPTPDAAEAWCLARWAVYWDRAGRPTLGGGR
jgi:hypothetical protein